MESQITSKGQTTIPQPIRQRLGWQPGTRLTFTDLPNGTVLIRAKTGSVQALKGILKPAKKLATRDLSR
jgi:AbrB family looped-hinge helix DNA binding protein